VFAQSGGLQGASDVWSGHAKKVLGVVRALDHLFVEANEGADPLYAVEPSEAVVVPASPDLQPGSSWEVHASTARPNVQGDALLASVQSSEAKSCVADEAKSYFAQEVARAGSLSGGRI
jgi:hypothetical protein